MQITQPMKLFKGQLKGKEYKTNTNFNAFDRAFFYSRNHNPLSIGLYKTQSQYSFIKETRGLKTTAQTLLIKRF
jgi:cytochrome c peroxidase